MIAALIPRLSADALDQLMLFMPDAPGYSRPCLTGSKPAPCLWDSKSSLTSFVTRLNKSGAYPRSGALAALHCA